MMQTPSRRSAVGAAIVLALLAMPAGVVAQDTETTGNELADASPGAEAMSSTTSTDDSAGSRLPGPLGECGGAEFRVLMVEAPFGEPLGPELASGTAEVEYLLPEGAMNAFISLSVPDAARLSLLGSEILEWNAEAPNINPDASYSSDTMTATILDPKVGERTVASVGLFGASEAVYIEKWGFSGVELSDFLDPPYAHGDHLDVFLTFELDGASHSWSSQNSTADCFVR